jgi:hypothetical protein
MNQLFKGQSLFTITLDTGYNNLAGAEVKKILYQKPDGTKGEWEATASGTQLIYDVEPGDIDSVGTWQLQAYIEVGGKPSFGTISTQYFSQPLN